MRASTSARQNSIYARPAHCEKPPPVDVASVASEIFAFNDSLAHTVQAELLFDATTRVKNIFPSLPHSRPLLPAKSQKRLSSETINFQHGARRGAGYRESSVSAARWRKAKRTKEVRSFRNSQNIARFALVTGTTCDSSEINRSLRFPFFSCVSFCFFFYSRPAHHLDDFFEA